MTLLRLVLGAGLAAALSNPALGQGSTNEAGSQPASRTSAQSVIVTAPTPLPGAGVDIDKLPGSIQILNSGALSREGAASVTSALNGELGSININDNLDDPFQPDILYRGFEASPVLGTPEGLAVYQNGVRINEAFGDGLNWDLLPDIAIDRLTITSANPVYGLNALGGALAIDMKNGFTYQGGEAEASGGSWGQRSAVLQYGANTGRFGVYVAGRALDEDGWRQFSPDAVRQVYTDLGYHGRSLALDLSFTGADNRLSGESPAPLQELAVSQSLVFTNPQNNVNKLVFVTLNGEYEWTGSISIDGNLYYRDYQQSVVNGNTTDDAACTSPAYSGFLCQSGGATPLTNAAGALLPDISQGGTVYIGEKDFESIHSIGVGGSLQVTDTHALFGHDNHLALGATLDHDRTEFGSSAEIGVINAALAVTNSGLYVDTPEGLPWTATPVSLEATNRYYGAFGTDTLNVTPNLSVTASGRYNLALIDLADRRGAALSGRNRFSRFNPALGLAQKLSHHLTAYAGYSENSRTPTPSEIECANPAAPCLLPSSLSSDPPTLRQVVAHTWEAGVRGRISWPAANRRIFSWNLDLFRTEVADDIYGVATSLSAGYFRNIGGTRRQGAELSLNYRDDRLTAFLSYSYVAASFQSSILVNSPQNVFADASGYIRVRPGDALPGIPSHRIKAGADYHVTPSWLVGAEVIYESDQYFRGDESNQMKPLAGYAIVDLHSSYTLTSKIELFVNVVNALDAHYATFGVLGDPTGIGAPGIPAGSVTNEAGVDNRFESPGPPISAFGGVRIRF